VIVDLVQLEVHPLLGIDPVLIGWTLADAEAGRRASG
jgi:hypothetical protein